MKIDERTYFEKVYGCWLGKNIGGSIGCPFEGEKDFIDLPYKYPDEILANDDIDLQLVWLDILKKKGIRINSDDLTEGWRNNITYTFDEYGVAKANLKLGLNPPITGIYNNWFKNCMGAPIRSEIWACITPGKPEIAGYYAFRDASVDHWDEGVYGEIFLSVLESIAFVENDTEKLIKEAVEFLPDTSKVFHVVKFTYSLHKEGKSLKEIREKIIEKFGHHNFTDCVQNIGFIILGLLKGEGDFLKTINSAVSCGYDTDCTGATSGAIAGIILGREEIEKQAKTTIHRKIVHGWGIYGVEIPENIEELTEEVVKIGKMVMEEDNLPEIKKMFVLPEIPEFTPPLKFPFYISHSFSLNKITNIEKEILNGGNTKFKKEIFDTFYFPIGKYFKNSSLPEAIFLFTRIIMNEKKKIKIYPATNDGVKLWINKKLVLSYHQHNEFIPALHRPGSELVEIEIEKGTYQILIEVIKCRDDIEFAWLIGDEENNLMVDMEYEKGN